MRKADVGKRLVEWAIAHGAKVSDKVSFCTRREEPPSAVDDGDRICMAMDSIDEDEVLVEIPRSITFETPLAETSPSGVPQTLLEALSRISCPGLETRSLAVALLIHHEKSRGESSHFAAYLDSLPTSFSMMPLCDEVPPWLQDADEQEAKLYQGTNIERLAQAGIGLSSTEGASKMASLIEELDPDRCWYSSDRCNLESLRWAGAVVQSRAHASKKGGTALVPLADSFNHSPASPNLELCEGPFAFQVRALCQVKRGEELLLSYGSFSNAELLFNAGFVCSANPHECVLVSRSEIVAAVRLYRRDASRNDASNIDDFENRCEKLSEGLAPPRLTSGLPLLGGAVPSKVVEFIAGLLVTHEDFVVGVHKTWAEPSPRGTSLRSEIMQVLFELLENVLKPRYSSCALENEKVDNFASHIKQQRYINVCKVRSGEGAILTRLFSAVVARLPTKTQEVVVPLRQEAIQAAKRLKTE